MPGVMSKSRSSISPSMTSDLNESVQSFLTTHGEIEDVCIVNRKALMKLDIWCQLSSVI